MVPIEVHGDDAEAHKRRSFLCVSIRSPITRGATYDVLFPCYVLDSDQTAPGTVTRYLISLPIQQPWKDGSADSWLISIKLVCPW